MDRGDEPVTDPDQARQLRAQAARIHVESIVAALLLMGLSLLASGWVGGA